MSTTTEPLSYAPLLLALVRACAPSLSSQVSSVRSLAHVQQVPLLREGDASSHLDVRQVLEQPLDADAAVRIALLNNRAVQLAADGIEVG